MKRKLLSLALSFALCLTLLPGTALAADDKADTWDGTANTSWYDENETEYHIFTAEQLAGLAELLNKDGDPANFAGKTVYLDKDLDLADREWISIGNGLAQQNATQNDPDWYYSFNGTFDGQGHVIYNLYSHDSLLDNNECFDENNLATAHGRDVYTTGLFGKVYDGTIQNLGVEDADIWIDPNDVSTYGESILVDFLEKSTVKNCWTTGSVTGGEYFEKFIGGVVGTILDDCTVSGCYSTATITGKYSGSGYSESSMYNFYDSLGGIVGGMIYGSVSISDCWFGGEISVDSIQAAVGGIVGAVDDADVQNCMVTTESIEKDPVTDDDNTYWVAYLFDGTVENSYWPDNEKYAPSTLTDDDQGTAVSDFTADAVLAGLQDHAGSGVTWVAGIDHPTFDWDSRNIAADYTAVDAAIKAARAVDGMLYANYSAVQDAIDAVEYNKSKADQAQVNAMAKAIEDAVAKLTYRSADYTKVDEAVAKADALNEADYTDFSAVKAALEAVDRTKNITQQAEVDAMAQAIEDAVSGLTRKSTGSDRDDSSSTPSYPVTAPDKADNGSVSVSPKNAIQGSTVTVKVTPDSGYEIDKVTVTDSKGNTIAVTDKGDGKFSFTMPDSKVDVKATFVKAEVKPGKTTFVDVPDNSWYADAADFVAQRGLMSGVGENLFGGGESTTRAMLMTILARMDGQDVTGGSTWYEKAMNWAKQTGVSDGTMPEVNITREQLATMLYSYAKLKGIDTTQGGMAVREFADYDSISAWANQSMTWAVNAGILSGRGNNTLAPTAGATRAEMAVMLQQFVGLMEK